MFEFLYIDRIDAAKKLTEKLLSYKNNKNTYVVGLARGGVILAQKIAKNLKLPLDIVVPRKIGAPFNEELAIGALIEEEVLLNDRLIKQLGASEKYLKEEIQKQKALAKKRSTLFSKYLQKLDYKNKTILLIDDGIATGYTMKAAIKYLRAKKVKKIILAIPVAPFETMKAMESLVEEVICLETPKNFMAVGQFYKSFNQVTDDEIVELLQKEG